MEQGREDTISPKHGRSADRYVMEFNKCHNRDGHLFRCQEDFYLKGLLRYIHLNWIRAGEVKGLGELNRSQETGQSALMGHQSREW